MRVTGRDISLWRNSLSGVKALAVDDGFVLLAGGYGDNADRLALLKLEQGQARLIGSLASLEIEDAELVAGNSSVLHIVRDNIWKQISVSQARTYFS